MSQRFLTAANTLQLMPFAFVVVPAQTLCRLTAATMKLTYNMQRHAHLSRNVMAVWAVVLEGHVSC